MQDFPYFITVHCQSAGASSAQAAAVHACRGLGDIPAPVRVKGLGVTCLPKVVKV